MADSIGPRIYVEGEKEFRDAINKINTELKTLDSEMEKVASQFDKNEKSVESLTARIVVLDKEIDTQKKRAGRTAQIPWRSNKKIRRGRTGNPETANRPRTKPRQR
jgi:chromosome segregation ATPase